MRVARRINKRLRPTITETASEPSPSAFTLTPPSMEISIRSCVLVVSYWQAMPLPLSL